MRSVGYLGWANLYVNGLEALVKPLDSCQVIARQQPDK